MKFFVPCRLANRQRLHPEPRTLHITPQISQARLLALIPENYTQYETYTQQPDSLKRAPNNQIPRNLHPTTRLANQQRWRQTRRQPPHTTTRKLMRLYHGELCDEYLVGPSIRPICTRCFIYNDEYDPFTMTNEILVSRRLANRQRWRQTRRRPSTKWSLTRPRAAICSSSLCNVTPITRWYRTRRRWRGGHNFGEVTKVYSKLGASPRRSRTRRRRRGAAWSKRSISSTTVWGYLAQKIPPPPPGPPKDPGHRPAGGS